MLDASTSVFLGSPFDSPADHFAGHSFSGMLCAMPKFLIIVIVLGALAVGGYIGYETYQKKAGGSSAPAASNLPPGPQPGDPVLDADFSPSVVMGMVAQHRKKEDQEAEAATLVGKWLPTTGWNGPVQVITDESGGKAYRMQFTASGLLTNEFWVVAVVPDGRQFYKGYQPEVRNFITFGGRIDKVEVIPASTYKPVPDYRIVVKDAYVISITGK